VKALDTTKGQKCIYTVQYIFVKYACLSEYLDLAPKLVKNKDDFARGDLRYKTLNINYILKNA